MDNFSVSAKPTASPFPPSPTFTHIPVHDEASAWPPPASPGETFSHTSATRCSPSCSPPCLPASFRPVAVQWYCCTFRRSCCSRYRSGYRRCCDPFATALRRNARPSLIPKQFVPETGVQVELTVTVTVTVAVTHTVTATATPAVTVTVTVTAAGTTTRRGYGSL